MIEQSKALNWWAGKKLKEDRTSHGKVGIVTGRQLDGLSLVVGMDQLDRESARLILRSAQQSQAQAVGIGPKHDGISAWQKLSCEGTDWVANPLVLKMGKGR